MNLFTILLSLNMINPKFIVMSDSQKQKVESAKSLAPFFEVSVTLKIFGHVIWSWSYPPRTKGGVIS